MSVGTILPALSKPLRSLLAVAALVTVLALTPAGRLRAKAAVVLAESLGVSLPRPLAGPVADQRTSVGGVEGRLFGEGGRAILVVPGATPAGEDDVRVARVATALASAGHLVFVPRLELYREQLEEVDLERIVAATVALAEKTDGPVTVLGTSYGGSLALVAAADRRLDGHLGRVATLGSYFDLVGLIQAITTGESVVGEERIPWEGHPLALQVLYARTAEWLPEPDRTALIDRLGTGGSADGLSAAAASLHALLTNRDPHRTFALAEELPADIVAFIRRFSPSTVAADIVVPVAAVHSTDDPLVPYGELARLQAGLPGARTTTVSLFRHVDVRPASLGEWASFAGDLLRLWSFTTWILER